jgi:hypothetical protein
MCGALRISGVRPQVFATDYLHTNVHNIPGGLNPMTFALMHLPDACGAFRHLRKIYIGLKFNFLRTDEGRLLKGRGIGRNLAKALGAAEELEDLSLMFNECQNYMPLKRYLGANFTCTWPHLHSLSFSGKNFHHEEFAKFADLVARHNQTLQRLHLDSLVLIGGNWWEWAEEILPWASSSLKDIKFTGLAHDYHGFRVPACCLESYVSLGSYNRDCCDESRSIGENLSDKEVMEKLQTHPESSRADSPSIKFHTDFENDSTMDADDASSVSNFSDVWADDGLYRGRREDRGSF